MRQNGAGRCLGRGSDVLSDVLLESCGARQEVGEEALRFAPLDVVVLGDDARVEVLPEQPSVTTPVLPVRHEA